MPAGVPEKLEELSYAGYVLTAMRVVNAIPVVCKAKPGRLPEDAQFSSIEEPSK